MKFASETELAELIAEWLAAQGWDVYPEVTYRGARADLIAVQGRLVWAVECKLTLGLDVMAQAEHWRHYAHLVSVAVPRTKKGGNGRAYARQILGWRGVGVMEVCPKDEQRFAPYWPTTDPALNRKAMADGLRAVLSPEHKRHRPGNADCSFHSPFRATCERLRRLVQQQPGIALGDAVKAIVHHYATDRSARSCLTTWIDEGKVPGVALDRSTRPVSLQPT